VSAGQSVELNWTASNATGCTASGHWSGAKPTSGTESVVISENSTFVLSCAGTGGTRQSQVVVTATHPMPVIVFISALNGVAAGGTTTLDWDVTNATSCSASGGWNGDRAVSGSEVTPAINTDATFTLTCAGPGGTATASVAVSVVPPPAVSFSVLPERVRPGEIVKVMWSSQGAASCEASGAWSDAIAAGGTTLVGPLPAGLLVFAVTCTNVAGSVTATRQVSSVDVVKFARFDFVELTEATHSSEGYLPLPGQPIVGAGIASAVLSGPVASATFEIRDVNGALLSVPALTSLEADDPDDSAFQGNAQVPSLAFRVVAKGTTSLGEPFELRWPDEFYPQQLRVDFGEIPDDLVSDTTLSVPVHIRNTGVATEVMLLCGGELPLKVSPERVSAQMEAGAELTLTFDVMAVAPVSLNDSSPKMFCHAAPLSELATGSGNRAMVRLPIRDVLTSE
jgi:hypothetical protein